MTNPWADFASGLVAPIGNLIDQGWYTPQEQARDALAKDSIRAQQEVARQQAEAAASAARYGALATAEQSKAITTAVMVGGAALVLAVGVYALAR